MSSFHKFYFDAISRARTHRERYGQAMFNHLETIRPDLANAVRGTDSDPFYVKELSHPNWYRFVAFLESDEGLKSQPKSPI